MDIPFVDLSRPENIVIEIFDDDRWVKDKFAQSLAAEFLGFSETLAVSFALFPALNKDAGKSVQPALVAGFVHCVLDDLVVSTKLLASGKMMASGNVMRQAIEGICAAIMCASDKPLAIHDEQLVYWKCVEAMDPRVGTHRALKQLEKNQGVLGVETEPIERLKRAKDHYDQFSHPGTMGLATRMTLGEVGQVFIGGSFDENKLQAYRVELGERTGLAGVLPNVIRVLTKRLADLA